MDDTHAIVVTTINLPTKGMLALRDGAVANDARFYVIGDTKSPDGFRLDGAEYLDIAAQLQTDFRFAQACPTKHYARKNIGYLQAMKSGAAVIVETDDDNIPRKSFWNMRTRSTHSAVVRKAGWCNVYAYYSDGLIWPRGLPLTHVQSKVLPLDQLSIEISDCPIQQGLADENPDVDAIYRLLLPLPVDFVGDHELALDSGVWCPFNSQNTAFWKDAFPLLYLPYHCSFRMTDIWRSFIAQRLMWENGWRLQFHGATVFQERNEHDLMRDFSDEVVGYLNNERIRKTLEDLPLDSGVAAIPQNLERAYDALIKLDVIGSEESRLLQAWLSDIEPLL